jgi:phage terminase large subunit-like protein
VNILEAADEGFATVIRGTPVIPAQIVAEWFREKAKTYYIKKVVADRYRFTALNEAFKNEGLELTGIPSGMITHTKLHPLITKLFAEGNLIFGDDKLMRWYCWNVYVETKPNGNKVYEKIEPIKRKTDGFFAFLHAMSADGELIEAAESIRFYDVIAN